MLTEVGERKPGCIVLERDRNYNRTHREEDEVESIIRGGKKWRRSGQEEVMETGRIHYSTEREESYYKSQGMKLENTREYIKYIITLLWAMWLLILSLLVCNGQTQRKLTNLLWQFKSSRQVLRENFTTKLSLPLQKFLTMQQETMNHMLLQTKCCFRLLNRMFFYLRDQKDLSLCSFSYIGWNKCKITAVNSRWQHTANSSYFVSDIH